jgi:hypothetical protein
MMQNLGAELKSRLFAELKIKVFEKKNFDTIPVLTTLA